MQNWTNPQSNIITVDVLLFDQFSNHCLANCVEPMRAANDLSGQELYRWRFLSMDGLSVQSSSGLPVIAEGMLGRDQCTFLYVISSYEYLRHNTTATRQAIAIAARYANNVIGLDTGSWLMAGAGLLNGRHATIHGDVYDAFCERYLELGATKDRFVLDGNRGTCSGGMAAFDLALELIERHNGTALRLDVAALFLHNSNSQTGLSFVARDQLVKHAIDVMREHLEVPLRLGQVANVIGVNEKRMHRAFLKDLGTTPSHVYRHIRLSGVRDMLSQTSLSISEIAVRVGYENASAMSRSFKARFGVSPQRFRNP